MSTIVGLSGSLRKASYNSALLRAAKELAPPECMIEIGTIAGIPPYDADLQQAGIPQLVLELKARLTVADGLLLVTPEYHGSLPGVLKNAIDWMSRPEVDIERVFGGKKVGVIGASQERGGTRLSQTAWLSVFRALTLQPYFGGTLFLDSAASKFDQDGKLTDPETIKLLTDYLLGFAEFVAKG